MKKQAPIHAVNTNQGSGDTGKFNAQRPLFDDIEIPLPPPQLPTPWSRERSLLKLLKDGLMLTHPDWIQMQQGWRLAADVKALKYLGWEIFSERIKHGSSRIARYRLSEAATKQAEAANV